MHGGTDQVLCFRIPGTILDGTYNGDRFLLIARLIIRLVRRGTKGDNGSAKDLGSAKKVKDANGKEVIEVEVVANREDAETLWAASRQALRTPQVEVKEHRDAATKQNDHDRNSRTNVVLSWIGTNMLMIVVFTSDFFLTWADDHFDNAGGGKPCRF